MRISKAQERVFKVFDELIDTDINVWEEVQSNSALRKRCTRLFPSLGGRTRTETALYMYGFIDFKCTPSPTELQGCWEINDQLEVVINKLHFNEILACSNLSEDELIRLMKGEKVVLELEALSEFIVRADAELLTYSRVNDLTPHIMSYVRRNYEDFESFRQAFNLDYRLAYYNNPSVEWINIFNGFEFERLLEDHLFGRRFSQVPYKDCRPDFIIEGEWVDAKLSKGTALHPNDATVKKYFKHTNKLTIIYAVNDGADTSTLENKYNIDFKHISEFYGRMDGKAISEFESFIERASIVKGIRIRRR